MSRVIKGESSGSEVRVFPDPTARRRILQADEVDARARAKEILTQASQEAALLRARASAEREAVLNEARACGLEEGRAQAAELLVRAHVERDALLARMEREVVALALDVARKVLGREVTERAAVVDIAAEALRSVRQRHAVTLRVNPEDAADVRTSQPRLAEVLWRARGLTVREDPTVGRGGCIVETEGGTIDARLETQLEMLHRTLLGEEKTA